MFSLPASMGLTDILSLAIAAILVNNYILVQFLGCCSFFGVSKKTDTAVGMGMAVIFVMALASAVSWCVQYFILNPLNLGYMQTIAFILVIATLVQFVRDVHEEVHAGAVLRAWYLPAADYDKLCSSGCSNHQHRQRIFFHWCSCLWCCSWCWLPAGYCPVCIDS